MDNAKIGALIRRLRKEKQMTQLQLAMQLHISDKTVSKWERGLGCPDVSLIGQLSGIFEVDIQNLLAGELSPNGVLGGNLKRIKFYVCPNCGNLVYALTDVSITCCGKKMKPITPVKASEEEKLSVQVFENDFFVSSQHEMTREHYISFVALLTSDTIMLKKQYPEWNLQVRIPVFAHGRLIWYCNKHGLFYQEV
ncbi:MAG: helix-turn-helix domain-containing protein [Firmicutes bacterium]|nr:helix-turn-helix domain-containing protein [Bacillota bacterium]